MAGALGFRSGLIACRASRTFKRDRPGLAPATAPDIRRACYLYFAAIGRLPSSATCCSEARLAGRTPSWQSRAVDPVDYGTALAAGWWDGLRAGPRADVHLQLGAQDQPFV